MDTNRSHSPGWSVLLGAVAASVLASTLLVQKAQSAPAPAAAARVEPRTLAVHGQAEVSTTPDEVTIVARIDTFHASLKQAKQENDRRARTLLERLPGYGVEPRDVQTSDFSIQPRHEGEKRVLVGYDVVKRVALKVSDVGRADALLGELFEGGANALERVSFAPSKALEKRAEARLLAVKVAREKAESLARELGQKVGHPLRVDEAPDSYLASNMLYENQTSQESSPTLSAGKTRVTASVSVTFELLDP